MILLTPKDYFMAEEYITAEEANKQIEKELDEHWEKMEIEKAEKALDNLKKGNDEAISSEEFWDEENEE